MRNDAAHLVAAGLLLGSLCAGGASAATYFSDNFESQDLNDPLDLPPIGANYIYPNGQVGPVSVVTSPAIGTQSLELVRQGTQNADLIAVSTPGAIADAKELEVKWSHFLQSGPSGRLNAPMQNYLTYANGGPGSLAWITILDGGGGTYQYSDAFLGQRPTGVQPTLDGWDHMRMVLTFDQVDQQYMSGTYDLFVSLNGAAEQQLANDANLYYAEIPTSGDNSTMRIRFQKGPNTGNSYYDNLTIADPGVGVPGDFNNDSVVNVADIDLLCAELRDGGADDPLYDVNGDEQVTMADLSYELEAILGTSYGDTDLDGDVDLSDLGNLATNYGQSPRSWVQGDFDCDRDVDLSDLGNLATFYGTGEAQAFADFQSLASVPEPTAGLAMFGLIGLFRVRRRSFHSCA